MIGRGAFIGLALLCALVFSAVAAPGAMAETKTTTAFTCVKKAEPGGAGFSKEHCTPADAVSSGANFEHVEIAPNNWTAFDATNEKTAAETTASTPWVFSFTLGGLKGTVTAKKATFTGEVENFTATPGSGPMAVKLRHLSIHFSEVTLSGALATVEGCKVVKSEVTSNQLEGTSLVNTMEAEYKPEVGETVAPIELEGCKTKELNESGAPVAGTFKAIFNGATFEVTAETSINLFVFKIKASLTGKVTPRMTTGTITENPISPTTIIDP